MPQRSIRFSDELEARIEAVAKAEDRSFGYVVRQAVEKHLESNPYTARPVAKETPSTPADEPVAKVLGAPVRKSTKTPSLKDTWGR